MDKRVWFFGLLAVVVMGSVGAQDQVYFEDGRKLTLKPTVPADSNPLKSVLWKFGPDMVAEWVEVLGPVEYFGPFAGRTSLNNVNGQLEINTLNSSDSGVYSVEFNGKLQSKTYDVQVIRKVSKPTVSLKPLTCSSTSDSCTLSCDGGISEAKPITYSWRRDGGDWEQSNNNLMYISKDDMDVENFFCQMKNPVSVEESEPQKNPFYQAGSSGGIPGVIILIVILLIVAIAAGLCWWKREAIRPKISSLCKSEDTPEPVTTTALLNKPEPPTTTAPLLSTSAGQGEPASPNHSANHAESASPNQSDGEKTCGSSTDVEKGISSEQEPPNQTKDGDSDGKTS